MKVSKPIEPHSLEKADTEILRVLASRGRS
jgi:hypothetical protein